ncbi:hypothetical protein SAE01_12260 [Segetibacter aerophilus]|uniref:Uncharacterized protein n=2 Tax=Segetibacter aerophilus TaxID=670293 RepID=A0A512B9U3_9BACT|nr:hypothetical protein SAE01_12260 [Segetibacter aerophilus]
MTQENIISHSKALIIKISIITGWTIPDDLDVKRILFDQFAKKIFETYASLNVQEVEYAIRNNGTQIKDWGKSINLSLIDEALQPYLIKRSEIRKLEESSDQPKCLAAPIEPVNYPELFETVRNIFLKTGLVGLIPTPLYDFLDSTKELELTMEEKTAIRVHVEKRLVHEAEQEGLKAVKELRQLKKDDHRGYELRVRNECKKQAVANYFIKQNNIDNF